MGVEASAMTIAVNAVYEGNGVLRLEQPVTLKEKAKVRVVIEAETDSPSPVEDDDPTGWKTAEKFIGMWKGGTPGEAVGEDHDKYLYRK
jgi:predicted DNA-binding antitoxin AbrB/MazE fold protein